MSLRGASEHPLNPGFGSPRIRGSLAVSDATVATKPMPGVVLPGLPPHAASPRGGHVRVSSYAMGAVEGDCGQWLTCRRGGNTMPLAKRLESSGSHSQLQLAGVMGCARQLSAELTRMISAGSPTVDSLRIMCQICAEVMGAESTALLTAQALGPAGEAAGRLDGGRAFLRERNFERACASLMEASPLCKRLAAALPHELLSAAEHRISLNLHGDAGPAHRHEVKAKSASRPAAVDIGQVALRERVQHPGLHLTAHEVAPLMCAIVTPVADPTTGSTIALLLTCNSGAGYFNLTDELMMECAALHVGLVWKNHIERLRLVPMPGATLPSPDEAGERLRWQWSAFVEARAKLRERRASEAVALQEVALKPTEPLLYACRRILSCRILELRHALIEHTRPRSVNLGKAIWTGNRNNRASEGAAAASQKADPASLPELLKLARTWASATCNEIGWEATMHGGAEVAAKVVGGVGDAIVAMAVHAAKYHGKADGRGETPDEALGECLPRHAPRT